MTTRVFPSSVSMSADLPAAAERLKTTITYLEQSLRPSLPRPVTPAKKTALMRAERPPVHFYRYLYDLVGAPYNWISRRKLSDKELAEIIHHPDVYVYVLYVEGSPAGLAEIDARGDDAHDLKFFGLAPDYLGLGLGRFFLTHVIELAWSRAPKALRLETCSLDHPAALPLYQKCGFEVTGRRHGFVEKLAPDGAGAK
ncbi:MAG: GNAT family N-acetyltransferase [Parvularculaceae bacterium]